MRTRTAFVATLAVFGFGLTACSSPSASQSPAEAPAAAGGGAEAAAAPAGAPPGMEMTPEQQAEMEAWMKAGTPGDAHKKMAARVGNWDVASKSWMTPQGPAMESKGSATFRTLFDGRYLVQEFRGDMMGMPFEGMGLEGFDNVTKEYVSTWCDSMSTGLFVVKGKADDKGVVSCSGEMADPMGGAPCKMRIVVTDKDADTMVMEMWGFDRNSTTERKMMELTYTRKK